MMIRGSDEDRQAVAQLISQLIGREETEKTYIVFVPGKNMTIAYRQDGHRVIKIPIEYLHKYEIIPYLAHELGHKPSDVSYFQKFLARFKEYVDTYSTLLLNLHRFLINNQTKIEIQADMTGFELMKKFSNRKQLLLLFLQKELEELSQEKSSFINYLVKKSLKKRIKNAQNLPD